MEQNRQTDLEWVSCNICGGDVTEPFARRKSMQIVRCGACGLVYVNPRHTPDKLHEHYNSGQSSRIQYYLEAESADGRTFSEILDLAASLRPEKGRLLDVGCNSGTCLAVAREHGWDGHGIEINAAAAEYCCEQRGLHVTAGPIESGTFAPNSFDVVLMGDVIEHLPNPYGIMRLIQTILKPDGVVIISTPNIASFAGRALQIKPEEHLYYFSPATMSQLLEKAGLEVVGLRPLDRYHNLTAMTHSTTLGGIFQRLSLLFRAAHRLFGDVVVRLPLRENLLAVGRKPAQALAEVA